MLLHVRVGDLEVPVWFAVVNEPPIDIPAGTSFLDHYVRVFLFRTKNHAPEL